MSRRFGRNQRRRLREELSQPGFDFNGATVSLDGLEANIGIHPQGQQPNPLQKLMGYTVANTN